MSESLKNELSHLCQRVGTLIPAWTQGAGGNISIKNGDDLWIKATGSRLDAVRTHAGIARVDFRRMARLLEISEWGDSEAEENYADLIRQTTLQGEGLGRASMETGFHARLEKKYVFHFHSLTSLLVWHEYRKQRKKIVDWLTQHCTLEFVFVELCFPGWGLSKKVFGNASIYFLESHGIILQNEDDSILELWEKMEKQFCKDFNYPKLLEILENNQTFEQLFTDYCQKPIGFKCYFPDVAIFKERMNRCLKRDASDLCQFPKENIKRDRDMAELWLATNLLYQIAPDFQDLPSSIASTLKDLPVEKIRMQRMVGV